MQRIRIHMSILIFVLFGFHATAQADIINAIPDGEEEETIALVPDHGTLCPPFGWCGPSIRINESYPNGFSGVVFGTTFVRYQENLETENSFGPVSLSCSG